MSWCDVSKIEISQKAIDKIGRHFYRRLKFDEEEGIRSFKWIAEMANELIKENLGGRIPLASRVLN